MKTYSEVMKIKQPLEADYLERHTAQEKLRNFWHGRYWDKMDSENGSVESIFRDLTSRQSDVGPDIKLVYNVLKDVSVKYQSFLSPLPMIRMYIDPPMSGKRKAQATTKERYLYGLWSANKMSKVMSDKAWYLPLMGDCFLGIYPDLKNNMCRAIVRSPEIAFPMPSFDGDGLDGVIFAWKARQSQVMRAFPDWTPSSDTKGKYRILPDRKKQASDPEVEITEYSDKYCFQRFLGEDQINGVEHDFNFNLFEHVKFINVPGEVWGHGAVEQAVNLVEMGNAYLSLMMQSAIENVFPVMVLVDPQKAPEEIERGAGAVIPVNAGGRVEYLTPPSGNLLANAQWAQEIERMIQTDTSMPDVNFGQFQASIVTGKAINELQGAGTGSLVEMVQGIGIGASLVAWNEKAIHIGRTMFKDDTIYLYGNDAPSLAEINPRHFAMKIKGSQLVGSSRNEVVFMPHLDMHSKVVMGLQLAGAGLVSKQWQREQVGIPDSDAMDEEMVTEAIRDATLGALIQAMTDPSAAEQTETGALGYIETGEVPTPPILTMTGPNVPGGQPGPPPTASPAPPGAPGGGGANPPIPPGAGAAPPTMGMEGTVPPSPAGASAVAAPAPQGIPLDAAVSAFQGLQGITGRLFLVGEIVATGMAVDEIECDITVEEDRQIVLSVPFSVHVKVIQDQPNEPYVEVTPGRSATSGGAEPDPSEMIEE